MKNLYYSINRFKGPIIGLIMVVLACYSTGTFAQAGSVNITVNIIPPYSPYYSDYSGPNASKVLLIITNTTTVSKTIKLTGQLEGDNGIKISTKSTYVPMQPIVLGPNETKQLNGLALKDIFDLNSLNVYGIDKSRLIYTSRLPEGNYNFCIQAVDLNTNQILSSTAPLGCTSITIAYPEAPVLINPLMASNEKANPVQAVNFNWINAGNVPAVVQYILQVAELVNANDDPTRILNATSFPFFTKTLTNATSYMLSSIDPPLKIGKTYAWRVKAIDPTGKVLFKNDGFSAAGRFVYGSTQQITDAQIKDIPILIPDPKNFGKEILVNNKNPLYLRWKLINIDENNLPDNIDYGNIQNVTAPNENALKYQITITDKATGKVVDVKEGYDLPFYQADYNSLIFSNGRMYTFLVKAFKSTGLGAAFTKFGGSLPQGTKTQALTYSNLTAQSVEGSFIFKRISNEEEKLPSIVLNGKVQYQFENEPDYYPVTGSIRLTKYFKQVGADGKSIKDNISVKSINAAEPSSYIVNLSAAGLFSATVQQTPKKFSGGLVPYFTIDYPNNNYYSKPDKAIDVNGDGTTFNVGEFTSIVSSYKLNLHISKGYVTKAYTQKAGTPPDVLRVTQALSGLKVTIYRNPKGNEVPPVEAGRKSSKQYVYKFTGSGNAKTQKLVDFVVSDTTRVSVGQGTAIESTVSFSKLICALSNTDLYWINIMDTKKNELVLDQPFNFRNILNPVVAQGADKYYTSYTKKSDYTYEVEKKLNWTTEQAPVATVKGKILFQYKDGVGGAMPLANADIKLVPFVVLTETDGSGRSYVFPANMMSNSGTIGSGIKINPSTQSGGDRKADEQDNKFLTYTQGVVQNSGTKTKMDGTFEFKDIPLWDSVTVAKGLFRFEVVSPPIPTPPKTSPVDQTQANIWQGMLLGQDVSGMQKAFQDMVMNDAKNPLLDPYQNSSIQSMVSELANGKQGQNIGTATDFSSNVTKGGITGQYNAVKNSTGKGAVTKSLKNNLSGPSAEQEEIDLSTLTLAETGLKSTSGCQVKMIYRVVVQEKGLFCSPDNDITVNPLQIFDAGLMYSVVRSAKVNVRLYKGDTYVEKNGIANEQIYNIPIELTRDGHNGLAAEGKPYNNVLLNEKASNNPVLVDMGSSQNAGRTFNHVLQSRSYQLYPVIMNESNTLTSYKPAVEKFYLTEKSPDPKTYLGKDFLFGSEFIEPTYEEGIVLEAADPVIAGRLINSISQAGIPYVKTVKLAGGVSTSLQTDKDGYFSLKSAGFIGKTNTLSLSAEGYTVNDSTQKDNGKSLAQYTVNANNMKKGQKYFKNFYFLPSSTLSGYVVNAKGEHLPALYKINYTDFIQETQSECEVVKTGTGGGPATGFGNFSINTNFLSLALSNCKQNFKAYTESGKNTQLIIIPNDIKYFNDTISVSNVKKGDTQLGKITLTTREHRLNFMVKGPNGEAIEGATIQILDKSFKTDKYGVLRYNFMNISEKNFWVKITPPPGSDYIPLETSFTNIESKGYKNQPFTLGKGVMISGVVKLKSMPLENATVYISNGEGAIANKTTTGPNGAYQLHGISKGSPHYDVVVWATGPETNQGTIVGQRIVTKDLQANFDLTLLEGVNANKLLGYKVSLENAEPSTGGNLKVNGTIDLGDVQGDFKLFDKDTRVSFSNLIINPHKKIGTEEVAEPLTDIPLNLSQFKTRFKESYNVDMLPYGSKILVKRISPTTGGLQVKAKIVDNSFNFPSSYLKFSGTNFYFAKKTGAAFSNTLLLFATDLSAKMSGYYFTDQNADTIQFKLMDFTAATPPEQTFFSEGKIRMLPTITATQVNTLGKDISIQLPELKISQNGVDDINGSQPLQLKLENWMVRIPKWKLSTEEGGIVSTSTANVISTGVLDIPFAKFRLRNDVLMVADANVKKLNLGGIVNVNLSVNAVPTFGLDQKIGNDLKPHYILRMLGKNGGSAGSIEQLDGLPQGLDIYAATLVSSGEQYIDFSPNSKMIKAFQIIDFKPAGIESSPGSFSVLGDVNLGIPRMQNFYGGFRYEKDKASGKIKGKADFKDLKFDIGKGYVVFNSPTDKDLGGENYIGQKRLSNGKIELVGTVYEPNQMPETVVAKLTRTAGSTNIVLFPGSKIKIGDDNTNLLISGGGTKVIGKDWDYLSFTGKLRKDGVKPKFLDLDSSLTFKVYGEIAYEGGTIKATKMDTPLGEMNMILDFPNGKILGNVKMIDQNMGGVTISGEAEINIDKHGFYTFIAGNVSIPVPIISPFKAGFLAGLHSAVPQDVIARTMQFNHNKLPNCAPMELLGFLVCGRKDLFEPINFHLDLPPVIPLVSVGLVAECGVDAALMMNFANLTAPEMTLQVGGFGRVKVSLASITGTSASGEIKIDLTGRVKYVLGGNFNADFCNGVQLNYHVHQSLLVTSIDVDGSISMSAKAGMVNKNPYFRLSNEVCGSEDSDCSTKPTK